MRTSNVALQMAQHQFENLILEQSICTLNGRLMVLGEEDFTSIDMNTDVDIETVEHISANAPHSTVTSGPR